MENQTGDSKNVLLGAVIGGILGTGAFFLLQAQGSKKSPISKIGDKISKYGEMLEKSIVHNREDAIEEIEKCIPTKSDSLNIALEWVATGINIWKKLRKGA